jgi:hypothetical protein
MQEYFRYLVLKIHPSVTLHAVANACRPRLQLNIWFIHIRRGGRRVGKHLGRIKGLGYYPYSLAHANELFAVYGPVSGPAKLTYTLLN